MKGLNKWLLFFRERSCPQTSILMQRKEMCPMKTLGTRKKMMMMMKRITHRQVKHTYKNIDR